MEDSFRWVIVLNAARRAEKCLMLCAEYPDIVSEQKVLTVKEKVDAAVMVAEAATEEDTKIKGVGTY